jgi:hypothetical protein
MIFGVGNFAVKNTNKEETLMFENYNFMDPMEVRAIIF